VKFIWEIWDQVPGIINGNSSVRCVYLISGATLSGFILTNGSAFLTVGGGVCCGSTTAIVSNCVIVGNSNSGGNGAAGGFSGTYIDCIIAGNTGSGAGGGVSYCCMTNCVLAGNLASSGGGAYDPVALVNCTVVNNQATLGGGVYTGDGGVYAGIFRNCIIYFNTAPYGSNVYNFATSSISNCCAPEFHLFGCITNMPGIMAAAFGDYHLQIGSPCIDAGDNSFVSTVSDLDGNPRIIGGNVDLGAYEDQFSGIAHFVSLAGQDPTAPYTNWLTAATNIQDAIDVANLGEPVVVSNGVYRTGGRVVYDALTNRVVINNPVAVESLNGPAATSILGNWTISANAVRCVYMTNGATLMGFTLTNGASGVSGDIYQSQSGGGVWSESTNTLIADCVINRNVAAYYGGGAYSGTLTNCLIYANQVSRYGGGTAFSTLANCIVSNNVASTSGGGTSGGFLTGCLLMANTANFGAGASSNILINCTLAGNAAKKSGGGAYYCSLTNCLLSGNTATNGYGGGALYGILAGCTVSNNLAGNGGGSCSNALYNCILTSNTATNNGGAIFYANASSCLLTNNSANNFGGGSFFSNITNCTVQQNYASYFGGGSAWGNSRGCLYTNNLAWAFGGGIYSNTAFNCIISSNRNYGSYGSTLNGCWLMWNGGDSSVHDVLNNCIIQSTYNGHAANESTLNNCTVTLNNSLGGANFCYVTNSIIYNNYPNNGYFYGAAYCCTTPLPSGPGNFTTAPIFVDAYHQQSNSPCINAGNNAFAPGATDFDGRPRILATRWMLAPPSFKASVSNPSSSGSANTDCPRMARWIMWIPIAQA